MERLSYLKVEPSYLRTRVFPHAVLLIRKYSIYVRALGRRCLPKGVFDTPI